MPGYPKSFGLGDLVIFITSLEWDEVAAIEGEIGIVIRIFKPDDEINYFDYQIQLADGGTIPVWGPEVERLTDAE